MLHLKSKQTTKQTKVNTQQQLSNNVEFFGFFGEPKEVLTWAELWFNLPLSPELRETFSDLVSSLLYELTDLKEAELDWLEANTSDADLLSYLVKHLTPEQFEKFTNPAKLVR